MFISIAWSVNMAGMTSGENQQYIVIVVQEHTSLNPWNVGY